MHSQKLVSSPSPISIKSSSKCLTVNEGSVDNGALVNQYTCLKPPPLHQQWKMLTKTNDGFVTSKVSISHLIQEPIFALQNIQSGKCIRVKDNGSHLDQWDCRHYKDSPHQFWRFRSVGISSVS